MGVQVSTINLGKPVDIEAIGNELAEWLLQIHQFKILHKRWDSGNDGKKYVVEVEQTGFFRVVSGLVFWYKIELRQTENSLVALVDDGDIRKQIAGLGIALLVAWPALITAGAGMFTSGQFRQTILSKIEKIAKPETGFFLR